MLTTIAPILQYEGGDRRSALEDLERAIALRADWTEAYMHRSQIKREIGLQAAAIEDLRKQPDCFSWLVIPKPIAKFPISSAISL